MRSLVVLGTLLVLAISGGCGQKSGNASQGSSASQPHISQPPHLDAHQREATDAIERLGGYVSPNLDGMGFHGFNRAAVTDTTLEYVKWFPQLKSLRFINTQVTDAGLEHLEGLDLLEELNLYGTKVTGAGLHHLKGLKHLKYLNLNDTKVTDTALEHLDGLTTLETLGLMNSQVTDAGLEHLKRLVELKDLDLQGIKLTDAGLKHLEGLRQLERLDLKDTQVTDAGLEHLTGLIKLGYVYLDNTHVTEAGVKRLQRMLPHWSCISHQTDSLAGKATTPIPMHVTPFYNSEGPQIDVGPFSRQLASANADTIKNVATAMKKQWDTLPVETMYVAAIRHYDLGRKDEAVYWFYSAQYRARLFASILSDDNPKSIGGSAFEATSAYSAFQELAGEYINGHAFGNLDTLKATIKMVQAEGGNTMPRFAVIYPKAKFIPEGLWPDKTKDIAAGLSKLLNFIETQPDKIKATRKQNGIEGKY